MNGLIPLLKDKASQIVSKKQDEIKEIQLYAGYKRVIKTKTKKTVFRKVPGNKINSEIYE